VKFYIFFPCNLELQGFPISKTKLEIIFLASDYGDAVSICHRDILPGEAVNMLHVDVIAFMRLHKGTVISTVHVVKNAVHVKAIDVLSCL